MDFYGTYQIDDSNMDCGYMIVVDCNGDHNYVNPCDLLSSCNFTFPQQITEQCVIDFFNSLDTQTAGHYLRISSANCLEAVPISTGTGACNVGVDADDSCGYLGSKIIGGDDINIDQIGPSNNKQLRISYDGPSAMSELDDVSPSLYNSCDESTNALVGRFAEINTTTNTIQGKCVEKPMGAIFADGDIQANGLVKNTIKHYGIGGLNKYIADKDMVKTTDLPTGIDGFIGSSFTQLVATKSGIRQISIKGNVRVNAGVQAFRVYVISSDSSLNGCVDSKFGASDNPKQPLVRRYDQPINETTYSYFNIGGSCLAYVPSGTRFSLALAVDTNAGTDITPNVILFAGGLTGGTYEGATPDDILGNISGTSLQLVYMRENNFDLSSL